ncbi:pro-sigmaK processing inhibitor BofA family protein [Sporosarcina gallistercoris]|uniref:Pro-sigmaK processing inhibitor BofA family protein n=1 Tax=Sporosarcina gallistercoris TaxID=2762245 RepID=A0ABR8PN11_9BACL|nr:pro-sigmaK processing inhibitor BofA family protein [Sporosarcina gallistercoris]MBD7909548.1 pro-sigmaK processing inhibitor BofA family protein [Sporosarcina gallistercoris]
MKVAIILALGVVLLFILRLTKPQLQIAAEKLSILWFRLAFAFLVLFILNIAGGFVGLYVPINIGSGFLLAVLGIPGLASLLVLAVFL